MDSDYLYHYTGPAAWVNILNQGYLRATHAWHLADGSECRHAIDTIRRIAPSLRNNTLWRSFEETLLSMPRYVVCFSKIRNDSYQWKNYGADGTGACVVFDPQKARAGLLDSGWDPFDCQYNQFKQCNKLRGLATGLIKRGDTVCKQRMNKFWEWNIRFKREDFRREREVRYVYTAHPPVENAAVQCVDPSVSQLATECCGKLNFHSHASAFFDEKFRPFQPFYTQGAISEIILGPRFTASRGYWEHLKAHYKISQI